MNIVVAYKWAANPQDAAVNDDGTIDWSRAAPAISDYDPVAIEMARRLGDRTGAQVVGLTAGGHDVDASKARKAALSRGLDRLVVVADDTLVGASPTQVAAALAAAVGHIGDVTVVVTGDSSVDVGAAMMPSLLAGHLGWPAFSDVTAVSVGPAGTVVERDADGGSEELRVDGPVVLAAATDAVLPRVAGMRDILAAGKKPVETFNLTDLGVAALGAGPVVTATAKPPRQARKGQRIDTSDPAAAAGQLVAALRADGLL